MQLHTTGTLEKAAPRTRGPKFDMYEKFMNKKKKKEEYHVIDVWGGMSLRQLAKVTDMETDRLAGIFKLANIKITHDKAPIDAKALNAVSQAIKRYGSKFRILPGDPMKQALTLTNKATPATGVAESSVNLDVVKEPLDPKSMVPRPPVVTLVGHVDHGKTTLLDCLRKSSIVACESGGITQHIGVFSVTLNGGQTVTFLDTPGHAAFKTMRRRGTNVTDIVVLLVDAVEGPLEQTYESLRAIRDSRSTFIVAISKIDREGADVERVKRILRDEAKIELEEFGGDVPCVPISALKGQNVDELIETILAQAEVLQLSCDPLGPVEATVVESNLYPGLGKSTTALVRRGKLTKGQFLVAGTAYAKVRLLLNTTPALSNEPPDKRSLNEVGPSQGCKIFGWKELPASGAEILQVADEKRAKEVVAWRKAQEAELRKEMDDPAIQKKREEERQKYIQFRTAKLKAGVMKPIYFRNDFMKEREKEFVQTEFRPKVTVLIKTDYDGTRDAIINCLETYDNRDVILDVIGVEVGDVTETDVQMTGDFDGVLYTFNAGVSDALRKQASVSRVPIKEFSVIYKLIDDIREELSHKMPPVQVEHQVGRGAVLEEFLVNEKRKKTPVAGCKIQHGVFDREKMFKVTRGVDTLFSGSLASLKHFKDEVGTVNMGKECGLKVTDSEVRFEAGDVITCFEYRTESPAVDWDTGF